MVELIINSIEKNLMKITVQGDFTALNTSKIRPVLYFEYGKEEQRTFPITLFQWKENQEQISLEKELIIDLQSVFYPFTHEHMVKVREEGYGKVKMQLAIYQGASKVDKAELPEPLFLEPEAFVHQVKWKEKASFFEKVCVFFLSLFLYPLFLIDAVLAQMGLRPKLTTGGNSQGIKGILKHTNVWINRFSGLFISKRQWKRAYFKYCYEKSAKYPVKKNSIVVLSERLLENGSNMDRIIKQLKKMGVTDNQLQLFIDTRPIRHLPWREINKTARAAARAQIILLEDFYPQLHELAVRKETKIVQLWHACGAYKTFGFSRLGRIGGPKQQSLNHRNYDYAMVSSSKLVDIYGEAFGIPKSHVLPLGVPRTDVFFEKSYEEKVRKELLEKYSQMKNKTVVLFAPTFRGTGNESAYYDVDAFDVNNFMEQMPEDVFLIVKHHPFVHLTYEVKECYKDRVLDLTRKDNINDLLFLTNVFITDYSSSVFEAALLHLPIIIYGYDRESYMEKRDVYFDLAEFFPDSYVENQTELAAKVMQMLTKGESQEAFVDYFMDAVDGESTKRIANFIVDLQK